MTEATYAGTTGWSGTDTSREQAEPSKHTQVQRLVLASATRHSTYGVTVADLRNWYTTCHHGSLSSALTNLHRAGRLARLTDKRDRCHIYVLPEHVDGRTTQAPAEKYGTFVPADEQARLNEQARKEGHDLGWQEGYDRGWAERGHTPTDIAAREEGRRAGAQAIGQHINAMLASIHDEHLAHNDGCWHRHPGCALRAVRKVTIAVAQEGPV